MAAVQKRKIRWAISLLLVMLYFSGLTAQAQYGGGSGEPNDPYLIYTAEQMNEIGANRNDWDKHFKLMADIDLSGFTGTDFNIIGYYRGGQDRKPFNGVFDGNGHTISNFSYTSTDVNSIALFGWVKGKNAQIKDLGLIDPNVDAGTGSGVGSLVDWLDEGTVTSCYAQGGSVSGNEWVGGIVGYNSGTITNCYSVGSVSGTTNVGGLVGGNEGSITTSYSTGAVTGNREVGGLVGLNFSSITNCYSTGTVSGSSSVGGLVGVNIEGSITTSYSTATVTGIDSYVGGLVGYNRGTITNCYSTGSVSGNDFVGGLVGYNHWASITSSFWDVETSGLSSSDGGIGKTTAEMQTASTFLDVGWDFVDEIVNGTCDYWQISPGDYPRFRYHTGDGPMMPEGLGTAQEPYLIRNARDLGTVWFEPLAHYRLEASVDLSGITWSMAVIPRFEGTFDGNSYVISNLHIQGGGYLGLFGQLGSGAEISNLGLEAVDVNGTGEHVGGLVGYNRGTITNCYSTGSVSGNEFVGGLVGYNWYGSIAASYSTGTVSGDGRVGGLVGENMEGSITTSYSTATVSGIGWYLGGLVGQNQNKSSITMSYSTGTVGGDNRVGGLVGGNGGGTIANCYATGSVSGHDDVGGLVGYNEYGAVTASFWDIETSGKTTRAGGTGLPTAEMQMAGTFIDSGWDFVAESVNGTEDIWSICEGTNYPRLVWQIPAGDFVCPDGITVDDFLFFAEYLGDDNCDLSNDYCDGTDLDFSGTVDEADLEILVENWLEGVRSD